MDCVCLIRNCCGLILNFCFFCFWNCFGFFFGWVFCCWWLGLMCWCCWWWMWWWDGVGGWWWIGECLGVLVWCVFVICELCGLWWVVLWGCFGCRVMWCELCVLCFFCGNILFFWCVGVCWEVLLFVFYLWVWMFMWESIIVFCLGRNLCFCGCWWVLEVLCWSCRCWFWLWWLCVGVVILVWGILVCCVCLLLFDFVFCLLIL